MQRSRIALAAIGSAAIVASCAPSASRLRIHALDTSALGPCASATAGNIVGVVRITVPAMLDGARLSRNVVDIAGPVGEDDDTVDTAPGTPNASIARPADDEPFDIFLKRSALAPFGGHHKYLLARVILPSNGIYTYWDPGSGSSESDQTVIHGVARKNATRDSAKFICGARRIRHPAAGAPRDVARFFIDIDRFLSKPRDYNVSFSVGLIHAFAPGTPLLIDPKIYNDG